MTRSKGRTRGLVAVGASGTIATLIHTGVASPYPDLRIAYLLCIAVGVWGLIEIVWSLGTAAPEREHDAKAR
jgi:hypothetical protein